MGDVKPRRLTHLSFMKEAPIFATKALLLVPKGDSADAD